MDFYEKMSNKCKKNDISFIFERMFEKIVVLLQPITERY